MAGCEDAQEAGINHEFGPRIRGQLDFPFNPAGVSVQFRVFRVFGGYPSASIFRIPLKIRGDVEGGDSRCYLFLDAET